MLNFRFPPNVLLCLPMLMLVGWAAVTDLKARRISNVVNLALIATGFVQSFLPRHVTSPGQAAMGFAIGFGLPFMLFALGALGGGDVKLLAGIGTWVGGPAIALIFVVTAVLGMIIVLGQSLWQRRTGILLRNTAIVVLNMVHLKDVGVKHVTQTGKGCRSVEKPLPYAVPVLIATIMVLTGHVGLV